VRILRVGPPMRDDVNSYERRAEIRGSQRPSAAPTAPAKRKARCPAAPPGRRLQPARTARARAARARAARARAAPSARPAGGDSGRAAGLRAGAGARILLGRRSGDPRNRGAGHRGARRDRHVSRRSRTAQRGLAASPAVGDSKMRAIVGNYETAPHVLGSAKQQISAETSALARIARDPGRLARPRAD
jgi:hypothetical protein